MRTLPTFVVIALATLAAAAAFGAWVGWWAGGGVTWREAYHALEAADTNLPRNARERERLLLVQAMVEGQAPAGLVVGPRLHGRGTLATLQYQTFDRQGLLLDQWKVRALVPPLPVLDGESVDPLTSDFRLLRVPSPPSIPARRSPSSHRGGWPRPRVRRRARR